MADPPPPTVVTEANQAPSSHPTTPTDATTTPLPPHPQPAPKSTKKPMNSALKTTLPNSTMAPPSSNDSMATPIRTNATTTKTTITPSQVTFSTTNSHNHQPATAPFTRELPPTDNYKVGIHFCVNNNRCDILNLVVASLETIQPSTVLNYKGEAQSELPLQEILKLCQDPVANRQFYTNFLCVRDEVPRNHQGDTLTGRRYCAIYLPSRTTFREMRHKFLDKIGGIQALQHLGWYVNYYADTEPIQRIFAVVQGKSPIHGYGHNYAHRVKQFLYRTTGKIYNITAVAHNETLTDGTRVRVFGLQIGRSMSTAVERELRACQVKAYDGIRLRFKTDKKDKIPYEASMRIIHNLSQTMSAIPVIGLDQQGAKSLTMEIAKQQIILLNSKVPLDVETTHLSTVTGKYMVVAPIPLILPLRNFLSSLFMTKKVLYSSLTYPAGPTLPEPYSARSLASNDSKASTLSPDPYSSLSVVANSTTGNTVPSTLTFQARRQQTLYNMPPTTPANANVWENIPKEIDASSKRSYAKALTGDDTSAGDNTYASKLSQLTEENSRLVNTIISKDSELASIKDDFSQRMTSLQKTHEIAIKDAVGQSTTASLDVQKLRGTVLELENTIHQNNQDLATMKVQYTKLTEQHEQTINQIHQHHADAIHDLHIKEAAQRQQDIDKERKHNAEQLDLKLAQLLQTIQQQNNPETPGKPQAKRSRKQQSEDDDIPAMCDRDEMSSDGSSDPDNPPEIRNTMQGITAINLNDTITVHKESTQHTA